jgi:hypothetical protein
VDHRLAGNTPGGAPVKVGRDGYVMDRGQNVRG